jgi:hypothetical protein
MSQMLLGWQWYCYSDVTLLYEHLLLLKNALKVPMRENFSVAFFTLSEPIWVGDLGTEPKNPFFYHLTSDFERFWFFAAY